ncbi:MAG: 3-methyl-2-oxobutanoate hydroxymethyltransferase [Clostridia bacterium]|nr:3-methyl-2-oxobutanoate hydroxymethyltransferase [Clostridia bacterium]
MGKVTTATLRRMKEEGQKITVLTAYDYSMAKILDEAEIDVLLVGDSLGMVMLGYDSTLPVTMEEMLHHVKAVTRAASRSMVIADMPFLSYHLGLIESLRNAGRLIQEGGVQAVKLEGGQEVAETVAAMVKAGIPVMGHLGLTPQQVNQLGGYFVQGKDEGAARKILDDALALEEAGVFSIVLECVPAPVAELITAKVKVPTIGIGAGPHCDGQVLVTHDILGLYNDITPKFVKQFASVHELIKQGLQQYKDEVRKGIFPESRHSYGMAEEELKKLY